MAAEGTFDRKVVDSFAENAYAYATGSEPTGWYPRPC